jgi:hypothetical protein
MLIRDKAIYFKTIIMLSDQIHDKTCSKTLLVLSFQGFFQILTMFSIGRELKTNIDQSKGKDLVYAGSVFFHSSVPVDGLSYLTTLSGKST